MTVTIQFNLIVLVAALIAGGLGSLAYEIFSQFLHAKGWICLWAALCTALFVMAIIKVS